MNTKLWTANINRFFFLSLICSFSLICHAEGLGEERVIWDKNPIPVSLTVGQERMIHFPVEVRYWVPSNIENRISILSANGVIYIKALEAFDQSRVRVQSTLTQKMYFLDVSAFNDDVEYPDLIVTDKDFVTNKSQDIEAGKSEDDWYIRLARFAAQSLYASDRLKPYDPEIFAIKENYGQEIPLIVGGDIKATVIKSWRGGGFYISAVKIENRSQLPIQIAFDAPQVESGERVIVLKTDIRGRWLAVIPQHTFLGVNGSSLDRTTLYLIGNRLLRESL